MNLREIHARAKVAAAAARLPLRSGQWVGTAGNVLGRGSGSSIDFQDHRHYVPGDDPRHMNWQAYARTGNYTMKLYRDEVTPRIDLVYDMSGSMFLDAAKATRAWEIFYFCLESGLRLGGHLKLTVLGRGAGDVPEEVPVERALVDGWASDFTAAVSARQLSAGDEPAGLADQVERVPLRAGSLRVLVSDLLDESPPARVAARLSSARSRGLVLALFGSSEREPDWDGNIDFEDAERGTRSRQRVDGAMLERYRQAYGRHFAAWREECSRRGLGFARVGDTSDLLSAFRGEAVPAGVIDM